MKTKPLNNNVLIEVLLEDDGVSRNDANEIMQYGKMIDYSVSSWHITASAGMTFSAKDVADIRADLELGLGKIVQWEQYAEGGQTFEEDGKTYALIPWWRLISVTEETK